MNEIKKEIKIAVFLSGKTLSSVSKDIGISLGNLSNMLRRGSIRYEVVKKIGKSIGKDIGFK
jgi:tetrahydromethanopterin S-methyltransferase subunit G